MSRTSTVLKQQPLYFNGRRIRRLEQLPERWRVYAKFRRFTDRHVPRRRIHCTGGLIIAANDFVVATATTQIFTVVGTSTSTVPFDHTLMTVEGWAGGAGGGGGTSVGTGPGGGGGAGGYTITTGFSIAGQGGQTFTVVVGGSGVGGAAGNPAHNGTSGSPTTIAASFGGWSTATCTGASGGFGAGAGGNGGAVTNANAGSTNTTGQNGSAGVGSTGGVAGTGHAGGIGGDGGPYGGGGAGGGNNNGGSPGSSGAAVFLYSP